MRSAMPAVFVFMAVVVSACTAAPTGKVAEQQAKEIYMDSFVVFEDGKPKPQFSVKEVAVNKGHTVRFHINVTRGRHDFRIDELNVYAETPTNQTTAVEFVADKAGEFIYYCSMPGHREAGHWGTLKVIG